MFSVALLQQMLNVLHIQVWSIHSQLLMMQRDVFHELILMLQTLELIGCGRVTLQMDTLIRHVRR